MEKYNYKNCQSLFGYAKNVHHRSGGICEYCGCGSGPIVDFDIWRQMTVEHIIGSSQKGYLKDIKLLLHKKYPDITTDDLKKYSEKIDVANTRTACRFCNSMTSRVQNDVSMEDLILNGSEDPSELIFEISETLENIFQAKKADVERKLESVREAFEDEIEPELSTIRKNDA